MNCELDYLVESGEYLAYRGDRCLGYSARYLELRAEESRLIEAEAVSA